MKYLNCYSEFSPTLSNPICQHCGYCYYCRDFREAKRCLADNGYLMIAETTRSLSYRGSLSGNEEGRLYGLKMELEKEGFEILSEEQIGDFTFIEAIKRIV